MLGVAGAGRLPRDTKAKRGLGARDSAAQAAATAPGRGARLPKRYAPIATPRVAFVGSVSAQGLMPRPPFSQPRR